LQPILRRDGFFQSRRLYALPYGTPQKERPSRRKALITGDIVIHPGSSAFMIKGGEGHEAKRIMVFYHKPANYTPASQPL